MEVHQLQIEQIDLLVRGLAYSTEPEFKEAIQDMPGYFKEIEDFLPKLVKQSQIELLRCNLSDIITMMDTFSKLWTK